MTHIEARRSMARVVVDVADFFTTAITEMTLENYDYSNRLINTMRSHGFITLNDGSLIVTPAGLAAFDCVTMARANIVNALGSITGYYRLIGPMFVDVLVRVNEGDRVSSDNPALVPLVDLGLVDITDGKVDITPLGTHVALEILLAGVHMGAKI